MASPVLLDLGTFSVQCPKDPGRKFFSLPMKIKKKKKKVAGLRPFCPNVRLSFGHSFVAASAHAIVFLVQSARLSQRPICPLPWTLLLLSSHRMLGTGLLRIELKDTQPPTLLLRKVPL
jgi:hypothetical protein